MAETPSKPASKGGDLDAFARLVEEHQAALRAFVTARIDDPYEAQDLAQETFLVAYRKLDEVDTSRPLRPWLYSVAANLVRNHRRKHRATPIGASNEAVLELLNEEIETLEPAWRETPIHEALESCLAKLTGSARDLMRLRYEEGLGIAEIQESLGGKHSAITMKLHRLREQLRLCIESRIQEVPHG